MQNLSDFRVRHRPHFRGPGGRRDGAASLKQQVVVNDDVISLADLFHDAGRHGERVVLQSPDPGRRMVLNANGFIGRLVLSD